MGKVLSGELYSARTGLVNKDIGFKLPLELWHKGSSNERSLCICFY